MEPRRRRRTARAASAAATGEAWQRSAAGPRELMIASRRFPLGHAVQTAVLGLLTLGILGRPSATSVMAADHLRATVHAPVAPTSPEESRTISMEFQDVGIETLARFVTDVTGRDVIIDDRVSGTATIVAPEKMSPETAFAVFQMVLQAKGLTTVPSDGATLVVPTEDTKGETQPEGPGTELVAHIARLHHADAATVARMVEPLSSDDGHVHAYGPANTLIIIDTPTSVEQLLTVIQGLDVERDREQLDVVRLTHVGAAELGPTLNMLAARPAPGSRPGGAVSLGPTVVAEERTNALVVRGLPEEIRELRALIDRLDVPRTVADARFNVYPLTYADAEAVVDLLRGLLGGAAGGPIPTASRRSLPPSAAPRRVPMAPGVPGGATAGEKESEPPLERAGEVRIAADPATNALVVIAAPQDFAALSFILQRLDAPEPQVYVETLIIAVPTERVEAMGLDVRGAGPSEGVHGLAAMPLRDARGPIAGSSSTSALVTALGPDSDVSILSAPALLAVDDEETEIVVAHKTPVLTGPTPGRSTAEDASAAAVDGGPDVSVALRVTPRIMDDEVVHLTIYEEISTPELFSNDTVEATRAGSPAAWVRSASASVVTGNGETMVIGAPLFETARVLERTVPYLSNVPILRDLLRRPQRVRTMTDLLVFVTPHILRTPQMAQADPAARRVPLVAELSRGRLARLRVQRLPRATYPPEDVPADDDRWDEQPRAPGAAATDWEVQAGATRTQARAEIIVRELAEQGYRAFVFRPEESGNEWYCVRIGGLRSYAEAQALARELIDQGIDGAFVAPP